MKYIKTRSLVQIRSHAQKYLIKLCKKYHIKLSKKKFKNKDSKHLDTNGATISKYIDVREMNDYDKNIFQIFKYYHREWKGVKDDNLTRILDENNPNNRKIKFTFFNVKQANESRNLKKSSSETNDDKTKNQNKIINVPEQASSKPSSILEIVNSGNNLNAKRVYLCNLEHYYNKALVESRTQSKEKIQEKKGNNLFVSDKLIEEPIRNVHEEKIPMEIEQSQKRYSSKVSYPNNNIFLYNSYNLNKNYTLFDKNLNLCQIPFYNYHFNTTSNIPIFQPMLNLRNISHSFNPFAQLNKNFVEHEHDDKSKIENIISEIQELIEFNKSIYQAYDVNQHNSEDSQHGECLNRSEKNSYGCNSLKIIEKIISLSKILPNDIDKFCIYNHLDKIYDVLSITNSIFGFFQHAIISMREPSPVRDSVKECFSRITGMIELMKENETIIL